MDSTWTVGMAGLGACKILSNRKAYGSFVSLHTVHVILILLQGPRWAGTGTGQITRKRDSQPGQVYR
jgi:hypothetical protein